MSQTSQFLLIITHKKGIKFMIMLHFLHLLGSASVWVWSILSSDNELKLPMSKYATNTKLFSLNFVSLYIVSCPGHTRSNIMSHQSSPTPNEHFFHFNMFKNDACRI